MKRMAKGKLSSIDGLTIEVFLLWWAFLEDDFYNMLLLLWDTWELYPGFNVRVLKLIPKKFDKQRIQNWSPIAMLNTAYKLTAKYKA